MRLVLITILTFLTVIPAVNCLGFSEKQAKEYLKQPGAVEQFKNKENGNSQPKDNETPPLVKEAEKFALYLNPPEPKKLEPKQNSGQRKTRKPRSPAIPDTPRKPERSSVKFDLLGTSHFPADPSLSFALIDEPGKGLQWVKQSSKIGHLEVEEIKNGSIIVKDNQRTEEVFVPQPERTNLLKDKSGQDNKRKGTSSYQSTVAADTSSRREPTNDTKPKSLRKPSEAERERSKPAPPESAISDSKRAELGNQLMTQITNLREKEDPEKAREKEKELIKEMFEKLSQATSKNKPASPNASETRSSEMNAEELSKLQDMGKELDKNNQPANPNDSTKELEKEKERIRKMFENLESKKPRDPNDSNSGKTQR
jgi:hypothetical protein